MVTRLLPSSMPRYPFSQILLQIHKKIDTLPRVARESRSVLRALASSDKDPVEDPVSTNLGGVFASGSPVPHEKSRLL